MTRLLLLIVLLAGCATSRPAADIPSSVRVPGPETAQPRTGAPQATEGGSSEVPERPSTVPASGAPQPTGGIGEPASYCKPSHCETPPATGTGSVRGTATWYCRPGISRCTKGYPDGMYAAAGSELRKLLGPDWRGSEVIVTDALGNVAVVRVIDFCQCSGDHVIDLYWLAFQGIVNPVRVTVP